MTTFTTTIRQPRVSSSWVIAVLALLVAGLTAALVVSLTSSSAAPKAPRAPAATTQQLTGTADQPGAGTRCPGSVKDWTC